MSDLQSAADEYGVTLLSVGCSSFPAGARSGFLASVTDVEIAATIPNALTATTYADLLAAFGRAENPFVISTNWMQPTFLTPIPMMTRDIMKTMRNSKKPMSLAMNSIS
jgi:hypothetical protein